MFVLHIVDVLNNFLVKFVFIIFCLDVVVVSIVVCVVT